MLETTLGCRLRPSVRTQTLMYNVFPWCFLLSNNFLMVAAEYGFRSSSRHTLKMSKPEKCLTSSNLSGWCTHRPWMDWKTLSVFQRIELNESRRSVNYNSVLLSWVSSCCTLLAVSEVQFLWDAIELHSSVLILTIIENKATFWICRWWVSEDVQVLVVLVHGAGLHFSRNSWISCWFNRARQKCRWIFISIKCTNKTGDNSAYYMVPFIKIW